MLLAIIESVSSFLCMLCDGIFVTMPQYVVQYKDVNIYLSSSSSSSSSFLSVALTCAQECLGDIPFIRCINKQYTKIQTIKYCI